MNMTSSEHPHPPGKAISPIGFLVRIVALVTVFLAGVGLLAVYLAPLPPAPLAGDANIQLEDGTWVSVRVTVGTKHEWKPPFRRTWMDWYRGRKPPSPPNFTKSIPELFVWVVRHDGQSERARFWPELRHARLDAAGEALSPEDIRVFRSNRDQHTYSSYSSNPPFRPESYGPGPAHPGVKVEDSCVYGMSFPLPPAGCGPITLTLLGDRPNDKTPRPALTTLTLQEPAGLNPRATWTPTPIPATSTVGPYALTITSLDESGSSYSSADEFSRRVHYSFRVELKANGVPCPTRIVEHGPLTDSAGNVQTRGYQYGARLHYPPHRFTLTTTVPTSDPKLVVSSRGSIADLPIPADNERKATVKSLSLRDGRIQLKTTALGGRGKVVHPDPTPTGNTQWGYHGSVENIPFRADRGADYSSGKPGLIQLSMNSKLVHLVYEMQGLGPRETLVVAAVRDDQNRDVPRNDFLHHDIRMVVLNPAADAKSFQVEWAVEDTEIFEFTTDAPASKSRPGPG